MYVHFWNHRTKGKPTTSAYAGKSRLIENVLVVSHNVRWPVNDICTLLLAVVGIARTFCPANICTIAKNKMMLVHF